MREKAMVGQRRDVPADWRTSALVMIVKRLLVPAFRKDDVGS